jgi:hypothetical protein
MARKTSEELEQIKKDLNIKIIWSWSKLNTYINDSYEYLLKYILKVPEDRNDSIYAVSGGVSHDCVEEFYKGAVDHRGMLEKYEDKLFEFNTIGLMYDRSDKDKNTKIAKKYEECMKHFFLNHKKITDKPIIEQFILIKVGNQYFQGYIDFINIEKRNDKNKIIITDWKTSSIYKGNKLLKESVQLLLYGEGMHQKTGKPYEDIIIRFNFMKYVNVVYSQKKGDKKVRQIERNSIGINLQSNVRTWLKYFKYTDDDIENYLLQMIATNNIKCLPKEVQDTLEINDCYIEVELNEEIINKHKNNIIEIICEIIQKENEFNKTKDKNIFWRDVNKENSYYFANLSGYSASLHKPYKEYLDNLESLQNNNKKEVDKNDLSWMDDLLD